jgi:DNA helicase-2/ATP-dependent DNA helicase PcrA
VRLAEEFDDGIRTAKDFVADIGSRFAGAGQGRGVNLLTYHRAKGLEYEAVFLPRVEDGELPFKRSKSAEAVVEERRLFYVGITRAKTHLTITWVNDGKRKGSSFVGELMDQGTRRAGTTKKEQPIETIAAEVGLAIAVSGGYSGTIVEIEEERAIVEVEGGSLLTVEFGEVVTAGDKKLPLSGPADKEATAVLESLKTWRRERAKADGMPAFVVFHDATLEQIAHSKPASIEELAQISGVGPTKLERYGPELIEVLSGADA